MLQYLILMALMSCVAHTKIPFHIMWNLVMTAKLCFNMQTCLVCITIYFKFIWQDFKISTLLWHRIDVTVNVKCLLFFVSLGSVDKTTLIIGISVSSIIFIGIIIIIVYRCLLELYDIREYQNFVKAQKQTEWKEVHAKTLCIIKHLNTVRF